MKWTPSKDFQTYKIIVLLIKTHKKQIVTTAEILKLKLTKQHLKTQKTLAKNALIYKISSINKLLLSCSYTKIVKQDYPNRH